MQAEISRQRIGMPRNERRASAQEKAFCYCHAEHEKDEGGQARAAHQKR